MKLAEALLLRSDMQKKLASLKARIHANVKVQEGDEPSESPEDLMAQANQVVAENQNLIGRIHMTNAQAMVSDTNKTMLVLLNERDLMSERHKLIMGAINATKVEEDRYSYREIKWQTVVSISGLQKQADDIAVKLRELNMKIQAANWQIDLVE